MHTVKSEAYIKKNTKSSWLLILVKTITERESLIRIILINFTYSVIFYKSSFVSTYSLSGFA